MISSSALQVAFRSSALPLACALVASSCTFGANSASFAGSEEASSVILVVSSVAFYSASAWVQATSSLQAERKVTADTTARTGRIRKGITPFGTVYRCAFCTGGQHAFAKGMSSPSLCPQAGSRHRAADGRAFAGAAGFP